MIVSLVDLVGIKSGLELGYDELVQHLNEAADRTGTIDANERWWLRDKNTPLVPHLCGGGRKCSGVALGYEESGVLVGAMGYVASIDVQAGHSGSLHLNR